MNTFRTRRGNVRARRCVPGMVRCSRIASKAFHISPYMETFTTRRGYYVGNRGHTKNKKLTPIERTRQGQWKNNSLQLWTAVRPNTCFFDCPRVRCERTYCSIDLKIEYVLLSIFLAFPRKTRRLRQRGATQRAHTFTKHTQFSNKYEFSKNKRIFANKKAPAATRHG